MREQITIESIKPKAGSLKRSTKLTNLLRTKKKRDRETIEIKNKTEFITEFTTTNLNRNKRDYENMMNNYMSRLDKLD